MSTSTSGVSATSATAIVGEISSLLPIVSMFAGTHLTGIGATAVNLVTTVTGDATTELSKLQAEIDSGTAGPLISEIKTSLLPSVETLLGLPPYNEAQLFQALNAGVAAVKSALLAL